VGWTAKEEKAKRRDLLSLLFINIHRMVFSHTCESSAQSNIHSAYVSIDAVPLFTLPIKRQGVLEKRKSDAALQGEFTTVSMMKGPFSVPASTTA
jgi:hypothetical protein